MTDDPGSLDKLRDIVVPAPVPLFPAGPGWIWLGLLLFGVSTWLGFFLWRRHRSLAFRRKALAMLDDFKSEGKSTALDISTLLKRVALATEPRSSVARLSGQTWIDWLGAPPDATQSLLSVYTDPEAPASSELLDFAAKWIHQQAPPPSHVSS